MNLETVITDRYVLVPTGSRTVETMPNWHVLYDRVLHHLAKVRDDHRTLMVIDGGAEGFDHMVTQACQQLGIPYALALPTKSYGDWYWGTPRNSQTGSNHIGAFNAMVNHAIAIEYTLEEHLGQPEGTLYYCGKHANLLRNTRMVILGDAFLVYDPVSPGTRHMFAQIKAAGKHGVVMTGP